MRVLENDMQVLEPGAMAAFEMDAMESGQAAARAAAEAGEGFWSTIWSGLKKAGGFLQEMASGLAFIYPQYSPPVPWKEQKLQEANEQFRQVQLAEKMKWDNVRIWYLMKGYWYSGWSSISPGRDYSKSHPYTCVDVKYEFMDANNYGAPKWGGTNACNVYDGTNRVQLQSRFQPMKKYSATGRSGAGRTRRSCARSGTWWTGCSC